jgi:hypothetical protein
LFKYSVTTCEPEAKLVFTQGFTLRPSSLALFANSAAATNTDGSEVLVQQVIAAMTTAPLSSSKFRLLNYHVAAGKLIAVDILRLNKAKTV